MAPHDPRRSAVARAQELSHGEDHDYTVGSPHLRHPALRRLVDDAIEKAVTDVLSQRETCTVLEVGAGHGSFTDTVLAAGGTATVTEMSKPSYDYLTRKFDGDSRVQVVYDTDGSAPFELSAKVDVVLLISVIHHIPEYVEVISRLCDDVLRPGGGVVAFQDPLWYPRQSKPAMALSWGSYFAWRITQGELRRGFRTRWRRLRGTFDESEPSDLVEYHVVRDGVDDAELAKLFAPRFDHVAVTRYFSTQLPVLQSVGAKLFPPNTFGIVGTRRRQL